MGLKAHYDSAGEIPEGLEDHYREDGDRFVLDVEPSGGYELINPVNLKSALQKERGIREKAEKALKVYEGLDPDEARSAMEKLSSMGDDLETDAQEKLEALQSQLQTKFENERKKLIEKFESERGGLESQLNSVTGQLSNELVRSAATQAISKARGSVELLLPTIERRVKVTKRDDGTFGVVIPDKDGNPRLSPSSSSMEPMTIAELVNELREDKSYSRAFDPIDASGSGATGNDSGSRPGGQFVISREDARNPQRYRAAKAQADKAGRELQIVD